MRWTATVVASLAWLGLSLSAQSAAAPAVSVEARALQPGEVAIITVRGWTAPAPPRVRLFGRPAPVYAAGDSTWRTLVGIDLDVAPGAYTVSVLGASAAPVARTTMRIRAKAFPTRRLTVDPRFVEPPPEAQARIAREAKELTAIWAASVGERLWTGPFAEPVPDAATSAFGSRSVFNGQPRSPHGGADFSSPSGRPIVSPNSGKVVLARDLYYTGQTVVVDHGLGLLSLFAHMSAIDVVEGAVVKTGDALGKVGATGRVTGPHLHWTVRLGGARVDPLALIEVTKSQ